MRPNAHVLQQIAAHQGTLATSAISRQEMLFGMYRLPPSKKRTQVGHYLMQRVNCV